MKEKTIAGQSLVAEITLTYQPLLKLAKCPIVKTPEEAYTLFLETWDVGKISFIEQFKVMLLNNSKRVLGICTLFTGSVSATIVDPKLVFAVSLKSMATEIILAHNHPSGNVQPSAADQAITRKLKTAGEYLELRISDHLIITPHEYFSFASEGEM